MSHFLISAVTIPPLQSPFPVAHADPVTGNGAARLDGVRFTGIEPGIMHSMPDLPGLYAKIRVHVARKWCSSVHAAEANLRYLEPHLPLGEIRTRHRRRGGMGRREQMTSIRTNSTPGLWR